MNKEYYLKVVKKYTPKEDKLKNYLYAFISGGVVGIISVLVYYIFISFNFSQESSLGYTIMILILLASLLTGFGVFDNLVKKFRCGLIIPITGFAHSITSAVMDYKKEGMITGLGANIFKLAGSVLLYGMVGSFIFVIIKVIFNG